MRKPEVKSGRGGKREGAGAPKKKEKDKVIQLGTLYEKESKVEAVGGKKEALKIAKKAARSAIDGIIKKTKKIKADEQRICH